MPSRASSHSARNGDALLLPAGKLAREGGFAVEQAHAGEQDVVDHVHVGKKFIALKHHAHFLAGDFPTARFCRIRPRLPFRCCRPP